MKRRLMPAILLLFTVSLLGTHFNKVGAQASNLVQIDLIPNPVAAANSLGDAKAVALVDVNDGWLTVTLKVPAGYQLPAKSVFEAWLGDGGALTSVTNNASAGDEKYGPRFANRTIAAMIDAVPYWLTLGTMTKADDGSFTTSLLVPNYNFKVYDAVLITLETDGNVVPWDPRPGATLFRGALSDAKPSTASVDINKLMGSMPDMSVAVGVSMKLTKLGDAAGLKGATGKALITTQSAGALVSVKLPTGVNIPAGAVLEAWVADGGRFGNFGPTHAHLADEVGGVGLNNAYISAIFDAIPFATSLGVLKQGDDGNYSLQVHWANYAFRVYDIVMVTLESDGDQGNDWNPRPGTPVLVGTISQDTDLTALLAMPSADDMAPPSMAGRLAPTPTVVATAAPTVAK